MAASTTVFSITPVAGIKLSEKGSTQPSGQALLERVNGSDGHVYILALAKATIGSITTVKINSAGSASVDSGSAGWTANVPGGVVTGQTFWAKRTTLA